MTTTAGQEIARSTFVAASPEAVYDLVSDLPGMGSLSPENAGGRWLGGATGPAVGARFRGTNRNGWRRWSTTVEVEAAEAGRRFAFRVSYAGIPVSRWCYDLVPAEGGVTVTETWTDRRPGWFKAPAGLFTGVMNREESTGQGIEHTLAALKAAAEARVK
jgi:hypothetical protein